MVVNQLCFDRLKVALELSLKCKFCLKTCSQQLNRLKDFNPLLGLSSELK